MLHPRHFVPAEEEKADHGTFEKEGHETFDRERRPEDIADIVAVIGPVGTELELHRDTSRDPHGEINAEQFAPEFHCIFPDLPASHNVGGFEDRQQPAETKR